MDWGVLGGTVRNNSSVSIEFMYSVANSDKTKNFDEWRRAVLHPGQQSNLSIDVDVIRAIDPNTAITFTDKAGSVVAKGGRWIKLPQMCISDIYGNKSGLQLIASVPWYVKRPRLANDSDF